MHVHVYKVHMHVYTMYMYMYCASGDWLTSRPKGCSQPRELWFFDILMYMHTTMYMYVYVYNIIHCSIAIYGRC